MDGLRRVSEVPVEAGPGSVQVQVYDRPIPTSWKILVEMRAKSPDISLKQAAKMVGYSYQTVIGWVKQTEFQRYENWFISKVLLPMTPEQAVKHEAILDKVRTKFESHMEDMQDRLLCILETSENESLQAKIAHDWLDRGGAPAQRLDQKRGFAVILTPETLIEFQRRALEAEIIDGEVVNGHPNP